MNILSLLLVQITIFDRGRIGPATLTAIGHHMKHPNNIPNTFVLHRLIEAMLENYNGNAYVD